jgi:hypothetical protein
MNYLATINYESGETEGRYISISDDISSTAQLRTEMLSALNASPIYAPWDSIECSPVDSDVLVGGKEVDKIRITPDKSKLAA